MKFKKGDKIITKNKYYDEAYHKGEILYLDVISETYQVKWPDSRKGVDEYQSSTIEENYELDVKRNRNTFIKNILK